MQQHRPEDKPLRVMLRDLDREDGVAVPDRTGAPAAEGAGDRVVPAAVGAYRSGLPSARPAIAVTLCGTLAFAAFAVLVSARFEPGPHRGAGNEVAPGRTAPSIGRFATANLTSALVGATIGESEAAPESRLIAAEQLSGEVGVPLPFAVTIAAPESVPAASMVVISGIPEDTALSAGRPLAPGLWLLAPEAIRDLTVTMYAAPREASTVTIEILTPAGAMLSRAQTRLAARPAEPAPRAVEIAAVDGHAPAPPMAGAGPEPTAATADQPPASDAPPALMLGAPDKARPGRPANVRRAAAPTAIGPSSSGPARPVIGGSGFVRTPGAVTPAARPVAAATAAAQPASEPAPAPWTRTWARSALGAGGQ